MVSESVATAQALALASGIGVPSCHWMSPLDPAMTGTLSTEATELGTVSESAESESAESSSGLAVSTGFFSSSGSSGIWDKKFVSVYLLNLSVSLFIRLCICL
jgi:hypothetical protein